MAHTLESLDPGTPVFVGDVRVGDVRSVYAADNSRQAELLVVYWHERGEDVAVPAAEVFTIDDSGVTLLSHEVGAYDILVKFDASRFPTVHPLT